MRPRLLTILLLLLAGAVVNVGVAWGCAYRRNMTILWAEIGIEQFYLPDIDDASMWIDSPPSEYGELPRSFTASPRGVAQTVVTMSSGWQPSRTRCSLNILQTGFPFRTFEGGRWRVYGYMSETIDPTITREWFDGALDVGGPNETMIPLNILWPGMVLNTMAFAFVFWLIPLGVRAARQQYRNAKHLCPACAYPVGESPVCSECGRKLRV